jgi:hypothetical protein
MNDGKCCMQKDKKKHFAIETTEVTENGLGAQGFLERMIFSVSSVTSVADSVDV